VSDEGPNRHGAVPDDPVDFAVVGTDTGVGKTVVTAALVARLRAAGVDARGIKPAQTGHPPDDDAAFVADACGSADDAGGGLGEASTCLERLEPALAPEVAADIEGVDLSYERIRDGCAAAIDDADVGVVEGIGGLRVPLDEGREVVDLVAALGVPSLVVARSGLGTLNHTALTVEALERRGCPVHGIVLNEWAGETVAERTNPDVIGEMTGLPVWTVPSVGFESPTEAAAAVNAELPAAVFPTAGAHGE
jgi:dethiobiotin synthetase